MLAFALNSVLNRIVFSPELSLGYISTTQFAALRLFSGAIMLALLVALSSGAKSAFKEGSWSGGISLLIYAAGFSLAYLSLPAGIGALILFGCVQITMLGAGFIAGERLSIIQWLGLALAISGLLYMLWPIGVEIALPLWAITAMALAGVGWGVYSLLGRGISGASPLERTSGNFIRASVLIMPIVFASFTKSAERLPDGLPILIAIICGAVTSGLGYAVWYAALRGLTSSQAAIAQLTVPVIAAIGGLIFISEPITLRFIVSAALVLGGVALALLIKPAARR